MDHEQPALTRADLKKNLRRLKNSPVCIVTARAGEANSIARELGIFENSLRGHEVWSVDDSFFFYLGKLELPSKKQVGYYVTSCRRQGVQGFSLDIGLVLQALQPRFVVHAGVCAGYRAGGQQLGDVVFAEKALNYTEGKFALNEKKEVIFLPDFETEYVRAGDMQGYVEFGGKKEYHYGTFLTGSAVQSAEAQDIIESIRDRGHRHACALDMEASAFLGACNQFQISGQFPLTSLGVLKGVSDFGDKDKTENNEAGFPKAIKNVVEALQDWIKSQVPRVPWSLNDEAEPAAELVGGYYGNFLQRLWTNLQQNLTIVSADHPDRQPYDKNYIEGIMIVVPPDNNPLHYKNVDARVKEIRKDYDIEYIYFGAATGGIRDLYVCDHYLVDFPRTINKFDLPGDDNDYQVEVFFRLLMKKPLFESARPGTAPPVRAVPWDEFMQFLEKNCKKAALPPPEPPSEPMPPPSENLAVVVTEDRSKSQLAVPESGPQPELDSTHRGVTEPVMPSSRYVDQHMSPMQTTTATFHAGQKKPGFTRKAMNLLSFRPRTRRSHQSLHAKDPESRPSRTNGVAESVN